MAHVIGLELAPGLVETLQEVIAAKGAVPADTEARAVHATDWAQAPIQVDTGPRVERTRSK